MISVKVFQFNMLPVNTYVVWDGTGEAAVIDPGCYYDGEAETLCGFIRDNGLKPKHLLNTHLHFDHIFGNPVIESEFGLRAKGHQADLPWITGFHERISAFGIRYDGTVSPVLPENLIGQGDRITFGTTFLDVIHVPGHSPGSLVFHSGAEKILFTGDVLFRCGIGRSDFADGDGRILIDGIRSRLLTLPDDTVVYPGHGPSTAIGYERTHNPYLR